MEGLARLTGGIEELDDGDRRILGTNDRRVRSHHRTGLLRSLQRRNLQRMSLIKKDGGSKHREGGQRREENNVAAGHTVAPNAFDTDAR